jgi:hypothetical protein
MNHKLNNGLSYSQAQNGKLYTMVAKDTLQLKEGDTITVDYLEPSRKRGVRVIPERHVKESWIVTGLGESYDCEIYGDDVCRAYIERQK